MRRKRDYQKKDLKNPFFPKRKGKKSRRGKFYLIFLLAIIIVGLYFLNNSQNFKIKNIEVKGNETISAQEIKAIVEKQLNKRHWLIFSQDNIFFFNARQAKKELNNIYFFEKLKIKRKFFDTLKVELKEKTSTIVWLTTQKKYYLDLDGIAIKEVQPQDLVIQPGQEGTEVVRVGLIQQSYPTVYDQSNSEVIIGKEVIKKELIDFIIELTETLKANADFEISHYTINSPFSDQLTLITTEGWQVHFKTTNSVSSQVNKLLLILRQKVEDRNKLEYIDLRFGEKIFYK